jgi:hypothetical protein
MKGAGLDVINPTLRAAQPIPELVESWSHTTTYDVLIERAPKPAICAAREVSPHDS